MKMEKEITVLVTCDYKTINEELESKGFSIKEKYKLSDIYMISNDVDLKTLSKLEILKKCILVRKIIGIKKVLLYKYKKFDKDGNILEQGKVECPVDNIDKAIQFMKAINYKELFKINDQCIVYNNGKTELVVQLVNDKNIFIELESDGTKDITDLIKELDSYNLSYDKSNYFVKKAEIELDSIKE